MKHFLLIWICLFCGIVAQGQSYSSAVKVVTTYSQNEQFYLVTTPFDNESPSLRGKTLVYRQGEIKPRYQFERGFDSVRENGENLVLSNNGEIIFYLLSWGADEEKIKSVTIYQKGEILKSFTAAEITGCDAGKERCDLVYSSNEGTRRACGMHVLPKNLDYKECFLNYSPLFSFYDTIYLIDSKKNVHSFDLKNGGELKSEPFDAVYETLRLKVNFNKTKFASYEVPFHTDFPKLQDGRNVQQALAAFIGMKTASRDDEKDEQFRIYQFKINAILRRDGSLEIEDEDIGDDLPREKILEFFKINKFNAGFINKTFDKWKLGDEYFYFRNRNDAAAREERRAELILEKKEAERNQTADTIDDTYIPKNLAECFVELDKMLKEVDKKEMRELPNRDEMIRYHLGLGMWLRNGWHLWSGSRLQKYFTDQGVFHPDDMSSIILSHYHDYLNGKTETWRDWEKTRQSKIKKTK